LVNKDFEIGQLNDHVVALNDTLSLKEKKISNQTYKLNQAFLVMGTFKDLKEKRTCIKRRRIPWYRQERISA
jgi:hypothetical protein